VLWEKDQKNTANWGCFSNLLINVFTYYTRIVMCFIGGVHNYRGSAVALQIGRSLVRSQLVSLEFFIDIKSFRSHYGLGVDSAYNRNEYQEYSLGVKAAGA